VSTAANTEVSASRILKATPLVEPVVVTNETVRRVNQVVGGGNEVARRSTNWVDDVADEYVSEPRVPARPAKPGEFFDDKHHHKSGHHGHRGTVATVASERALLDDVARYRSALVGTIDELHTRLSPKYQVDQLKSTWMQAGTDALSILKNEGGPVDETRKKKAETILKAGGALSGLIGLRVLRKLAKNAKERRTVRKAVAKGLPAEHVELVGVVEGLNPEAYEVQGLSFDDADSIIFNEAGLEHALGDVLP